MYTDIDIGFTDRIIELMVTKKNRNIVNNEVTSLF